MIVFGYLILLSIMIYASLVLVSVVWEDISNTRDNFLPPFQTPYSLSKILRHASSVFGVWKCGQSRSFMFDKLLLLYFGPVTQPNRNMARNQSSNHSQTELICRSSRSLEMIRMVRNMQGAAATPLYKLYRDVRPQKVWFFSRYGHREAGRTPPPTFSGSTLSRAVFLRASV